MSVPTARARSQAPCAPEVPALSCPRRGVWTLVIQRHRPSSTLRALTTGSIFTHPWNSIKRYTGRHEWQLQYRGQRCPPEQIRRQLLLRRRGWICLLRCRSDPDILLHLLGKMLAAGRSESVNDIVYMIVRRKGRGEILNCASGQGEWRLDTAGRGQTAFSASASAPAMRAEEHASSAPSRSAAVRAGMWVKGGTSSPAAPAGQQNRCDAMAALEPGPRAE